MQYRILGPLEVHGDRGQLTLASKKVRSVLAVLLVHANEPVSADRLAVALWGDDAPREKRKTVHVYISRLRSALGEADAVRTTPGGYQLRVEADECDANRFERLLADGRRELRSRRPAEAEAVLREALELWRGPALSGFEGEPFAEDEIRWLNERRVEALESRAEAELAIGGHRELVAELEALVAEHPSRERLAAHLMRALYRSGLQAEALNVFHRTRIYLAGELGLEPGPELKALQSQILAHAPSLDRVANATEGDRRAPGPAALPVLQAPLLGRDRDVQTLIELLVRPDVRLVTVTGAGGVGKTSVAIEIAWRMARQL